MELQLTILLGVVSYYLVNFFITPVLRILTLRRDMHEKINLYGNVWGGQDPYSIEWQNKARNDFRTLASRGLSEDENLKLWFYCFAKWFLKLMKIDLKSAGEAFWTMEAYAAQPDKNQRIGTEEKIRQFLNLPITRKD